MWCQVYINFAGNSRVGDRGWGSKSCNMYCSSKTEHQYAYSGRAWPGQSQKVSLFLLQLHCSANMLIWTLLSSDINSFIQGFDRECEQLLHSICKVPSSGCEETTSYNTKLEVWHVNRLHYVNVEFDMWLISKFGFQTLCCVKCSECWRMKATCCESLV